MHGSRRRHLPAAVRFVPLLAREVLVNGVLANLRRTAGQPELRRRRADPLGREAIEMLA